MVCALSRGRAAFSLIEALVALLVLVLIGTPLAAALRTGALGSTRGSEYQIVSVVGARLADLIAAEGYRRLAERGRGGGIDLGALGREGADLFGAESPLAVDELALTARCELSEPEAGLIRARVVVSWRHPGTRAGEESGTLDLVRLVATTTDFLDRP
jgi:hypothetical protein